MIRLVTCIIAIAFLAAPATPKGATASRSCLTYEAHRLLDSIERQFGPVTVISTCRPGATVRGTGRPSRHASGNAIDFRAGARKRAIVDWLIATHYAGGTMTYRNSDHIHVDIGPRFVSLGSGGAKRKFSKVSAARTKLAKLSKPARPDSAWVTRAFGA